MTTLSRRLPITSVPSWATALAPAVALLAVQQVVWPVSAGTFVSGLVLGLLGSLVALGMALIWRSNRIVNFAGADLGALPATLVLLLIEAWRFPYLLAMPIGLAAAILLGAVVELAFIRRFDRSPRLILTVVTLGVSQLLAVSTILLPRAWGLSSANRTYSPPFEFRLQIGVVVFDANDLLAVVVSVSLIVGLTWFLRATDTGVAVRAAAERSDRAAMLGVPVGRLRMQVWAIAGVFAFASVFLTAGVNSLAPGFAVSLTLLLRALTALVMGRMTNLVTIATSAVALGVLEAAIRANTDDLALLPALLALIIVVALLLQRRGVTRADDEAAGWQATAEVRPIPPALRRLPEVRLARWGGAAVLAVVVVGFPHVVGTGTALKGGAVLVFALVGVSMVILSGWAGQISLGQMAFVGAGGAITAWGTVERQLDPLVSILAAGLVGALVAVVVGLPALRLRGLYLAVTTLGFALAASSVVFSNAYWDWIPTGSFDRPDLLGRVSLDSATRVYYLALVALVGGLLAARGIRRSRTGRVLVATRENERAAAAFGVDVVRARLTAFALSGFIAAVAGAVFVIHQASFRPESYEAGESIAVFITAVIGGLGVLTGAVLGALFQRGAQWFLPGAWQLFASSIGVLLVLMIVPDGLAGVAYRIRDAGLRWLARRRGIDAPSLRGNEGLREELEEAA